MAKAKPVRVKNLGGKTVRVECEECYHEFGSEACIRPAHGSFAHADSIVRDVKAKVKQDAEAPVEKEVLAAAIVQIGDSLKRLYDSGLNRRAVVALLADDTKLGKKTIEAVLDSLADLRRTYTK